MKRLKLKNAFTILLFILIAYLLYYNYIKEPDLSKIDYPTELHPKVLDGRDQLIQKTSQIGIPIRITEGFRSVGDQDALYAQGRTVNGDIVTHARGGESFHNFGLAIDFALIAKDGNIIWDMEYDGNGNAKSDWMEVVAIAKELGFEWGGDWSNFKDYPHLEMNFGLSIRDLQRGKQP